MAGSKDKVTNRAVDGYLVLTTELTLQNCSNIPRRYLVYLQMDCEGRQEYVCQRRQDLPDFSFLGPVFSEKQEDACPGLSLVSTRNTLSRTLQAHYSTKQRQLAIRNFEDERLRFVYIAHAVLQGFWEASVPVRRFLRIWGGT
jgi:hypothetical protein